MALFIWLAVVGQLLFAVVALIDKYIVTSGAVPRPVVYSFYVNLLSSAGITFFLFSSIPGAPQFSNVSIPDLSFSLYSLLSGLLAVYGFWALFEAFKKSDASDVIPVFQSVVAVSSIFLTVLILNETISRNFILGFILLVFGMVILSRFRLSKKTLGLIVVSGILGAGHIFLFDILSDPTYYEFTNRDNAYFWTRIGNVIAALTLLLLPNCCGQTAKSDAKQTGNHGFLLVIGNRVLAGIAGLTFITAIAVALPGEVPIVNALGGLQFLFLLAFSVIFGHKTPYVCGENCTPIQKLQKTAAIVILLAGFVLLFI